MSAEEYGPVFLVLNEEIPGGPPGIGIHPRSRLIQHHKLGTTNQSNTHTGGERNLLHQALVKEQKTRHEESCLPQLPLLSTRELTGGSVLLLQQVNVVQNL